MDLVKIKKQLIFRNINNLKKNSFFQINPPKTSSKKSLSKCRSLIEIKDLIKEKSDIPKNSFISSSSTKNFPICLSQFTTLKTKDSKFKLPSFSKNNNNDSNAKKIIYNHPLDAPFNLKFINQRFSNNEINNIKIYNNSISIDNSQNTFNCIMEKK